ncbi:MAG: hypothetical protein ACP5QT_00680 [Brevinematia bacterium]
MKKYLIISILIISLQAFGLKKEFSYYGLKLGLSFDETLAILETNKIFKIDESRFFGKINEPVPFIIKATYKPYISQIYVQFYSNVAYGITIQFNNSYFDYFSLSEKLEDSYGTPSKKTSKITEWKTLSNFQNILGNMSDIILRLEYPSTVKVFDNNILLKLNSEVRENIIRTTNLSTINSNRKALLNEL